MTSSKKAVIDIGSNSIRLLVAEHHSNNFFELYRDIETTRLGKRVQRDGKLSEQAIDDTVTALLNHWKIIENHEAELAAIVATSAVREASNSQELLNKINDALKLPTDIEIIDVYREAELTHKGAATDFGSEISVFDLGGGSLELIPDDPAKMHSVPFGAVKAAELFGDVEGKITDPDSLGERLRKILRDNYQQSDINSYFQLPQGSDIDFKLVGVGGTATYLVKALKRLEVYDSELIHCSFMDLASLTSLLERMNDCNLQQRADNFYLPVNRADIIVAGGYIIKYLLEYLGVSGYYASDSDILKGLLLENSQ